MWNIFILVTLVFPAAVSSSSASIRTGISEDVGGGSIQDTEWIDLMTATEIAQVLPELSKLREIYDTTEMGFKIEQSRHITIFMPTNSAIEQERLDQVLPLLPYEISRRLLMAHIIPEVIKATELDAGAHTYISATGDVVQMSISRDEVKGLGILRVEDSEEDVQIDVAIDSSTATVIGSSIDNANGVSYVIDAVLIPEEIRADIESAREKAPRNDVQESSVPEYIQETNLHHWFYGRVGGTPQQVQANADEQTQPEHQHEVVRGVVGVLRNADAGVLRV